MSMPTSPETLLDALRTTDLIEPKRLAGFLDHFGKNGAQPSSPGELTSALVREGLLTDFQAEQLLHGKERALAIGKFKVLDRLGSGAMGTVYLCEHPQMRRLVAVKVLTAALADKPEIVARFHREAKAMAAIDHPNLVRAHDIGEDGDTPFLVMDYVDGISLQQLVERIGPLAPLRAAHYICQGAQGLQHAHKAGLVHRDIKPGNFLVDRQGVVRLLDMGLARFFHDHEDILTLQYNDNTMLGTVDYVAPEQVLDSHSVDIRADIYSLGATLYFLLAGRPIFPEGKKSEKLLWHQTRRPRPIRELQPDVPAELAAILDKMLAKKPGMRYQTPAEVVAALEPLTQTPIAPPDEEELPQRQPAPPGKGGQAPASAPKEKPRIRPKEGLPPAPKPLKAPPEVSMPAPPRPAAPRPAARPRAAAAPPRAAAPARPRAGAAVKPAPAAAARKAAPKPAPRPVRPKSELTLLRDSGPGWGSTLLLIFLTLIVAGGVGVGFGYYFSSRSPAASSNPATSTNPAASSNPAAPTPAKQPSSDKGVKR
jgi:eukaryotic-like serine/threonine-protein kinase